MADASDEATNPEFDIHGICSDGLVFDPPIIDLGVLQLNEVRQCATTLANVGESELQLRRIRTTCSCTAAAVGKGSLAAGESTTLRVKLRAPREHGSAIRQTLSITPVGTSRQSQLLLVGRTESDIESDVQLLDPGSITGRARFEIRLRSRTAEHFRIRDVDQGQIVSMDKDSDTKQVIQLEFDLHGERSVPREVSIRVKHPSQSVVQINLDALTSTQSGSFALLEKAFTPRSLMATPSSVSLGRMLVGDTRRVLLLIPDWPQGASPHIQMREGGVHAVIERHREMRGGIELVIALSPITENHSLKTSLAIAGESVQSTIIIRGHIAPKSSEGDHNRGAK